MAGFPPGINMTFAVRGGGGGGSGGMSDECGGFTVNTYADNAYHTIASLSVVRNPTIIEVRAVGRRTDAAGRAGYVRRAVVYRDPSSGNAVILNAFDTTFTRELNTVWNVRLVVNGYKVEIQVRGGAGTVNWRVSWVFSPVTRGMLTTDGVYHTLQIIPILDDSVCLLEVPVVGLRADADGSSGYLHRAIVYRTGGGAATLLKTVDSSLTRETVVAWDSTIQVSGNDALIVVRGAVGQTVSWKSSYTLEELI